jgi:hypothetical protein
MRGHIGYCQRSCDGHVTSTNPTIHHVFTLNPEEPFFKMLSLSPIYLVIEYSPLIAREEFE